ncbi:unnamed protein product, partial [Scytosiphon promiscuus]
MGRSTPRVHREHSTQSMRSTESVLPTLMQEALSMAELIPSHVQKVARVYHESRTISPTQLVAAVKNHAEHDEDADVELSAASAAVAKAVAMDHKGKTLLERVEPIMSNLEKFFANNPNFEALYRSSDGKHLPGPAEVITKDLVEGLTPGSLGRMCESGCSMQVIGKPILTWCWIPSWRRPSRGGRSRLLASLLRRLRGPPPGRIRGSKGR